MDADTTRGLQAAARDAVKRRLLARQNSDADLREQYAKQQRETQASYSMATGYTIQT